MKNDFGLTADQLALITTLFNRHKNIDRAVIFGSRANGSYKKYSDVDIALFGVSDSYTWQIKEELDQLLLVYKFDVLSYCDTTNASLRDHIDRVGVVIFEKVKETNTSYHSTQ